MPRQLLSAILTTGLLVGLADGLAANTHFFIATGGKNPARVFQFISSGLLGSGAFSMGTATVVLGIALHFVIAFSVTAAFFLLYPYLQQLDVNALILGGLYGVGVWLVMNFIVLPLSRVQQAPFTLWPVTIGILIHIFIIGVPLGWAARHYLNQGSGG